MAEGQRLHTLTLGPPHTESGQVVRTVLHGKSRDVLPTFNGPKAVAQQSWRLAGMCVDRVAHGLGLGTLMRGGLIRSADAGVEDGLRHGWIIRLGTVHINVCP